MTFLDDVVHSLLKGENTGITSRRRSRASQNSNTVHVCMLLMVDSCKILFLRLLRVITKKLIVKLIILRVITHVPKQTVPDQQ